MAIGKPVYSFFLMYVHQWLLNIELPYADNNIYIYTVTTFKYVEGWPDGKAPEVVWNTSSYI